LFLDRLRQALARTHHRSGPEGVAVLLLDLDDFKLINDSLGHAAGDDLLCSVAQRLSDSLRPGDTAARLGGDEFALLLEPVADAAEVVVVAEQLRALVHAPLQLAGRILTLGDSEAPGDTALVQAADIALFQAKSGGKGCVIVFDESMQRQATARLELLG